MNIMLTPQNPFSSSSTTENFPSLSPFLKGEGGESAANTEAQTLSIGTRSALNTHIRSVINSGGIDSKAIDFDSGAPQPPDKHSSDYWTPQKHLKTPPGNVISDPCTSRGDEVFFSDDSSEEEDQAMADVFMECVRESQLSDSEDDEGDEKEDYSMSNSNQQSPLPIPTSHTPGNGELFVSPSFSPGLSPMRGGNGRTHYEEPNSRELDEEFQSVATPVVKMQPEVDREEVKGDKNDRFLRLRHKTLSPALPDSPPLGGKFDSGKFDSSLNSVSLLESFQDMSNAQNHNNMSYEDLKMSSPNFEPSPVKENNFMMDEGDFEGTSTMSKPFTASSALNRHNLTQTLTSETMHMSSPHAFGRVPQSSVLTSTRPIEYWGSNNVENFSDGSKIVREEGGEEDVKYWRERLGGRYAFNNTQDV
ncbi:hypothetical protein TL16_g03441 [Triparma laevis f. inornata]|uniref:Uncharacterized protein n=1 Tax=Triparma laevis f. inornata TaxID=1714386 RepID=A0A9W7A3K6_9STRA|nr:hypothetical protein TL16_g03441 [Triparma laevis f. inornata]